MSALILNGNFSGAIGPNIIFLSPKFESGSVYTAFNPLLVISNSVFIIFSTFCIPSV